MMSIERSIAVVVCAFFISLITIAFFKRAGSTSRLTVVMDKDGIITFVDDSGPGQIRDQKLALAALG